MKKLVFLFVAIFSLAFMHEAEASHAAGGEITYRYIGDSTGIPFQYEITVYFYRSTSGIPAPSPTPVSVSNSCGLPFTWDVPMTAILPDSSQAWKGIPTYSNYDANGVPQDTTYGGGDGAGFAVPTLDECVRAYDEDFVEIAIYKSVGIITLGGVCPDWKFSFSESARNSEIDNLANLGNLDVEALLNNVRGPNTSPTFIVPAAKSFCKDLPFVWSQASIEPDGDSIYYTFAEPICNGTPCGWAPGYSLTDPMHTKNGISVNAATGEFRFEPINVENVVIKIQVEEYRYDSTQTQWILTGYIARDLQIPIVAECSEETKDGPAIDVTSSNFEYQKFMQSDLLGYGIDSIYVPDSRSNFIDTGGLNEYQYDIPTLTGYDCYDDKVTLEFTEAGVTCESIDPTDFRILSLTDTVSRPVISFIDNCQPDLVTNKIDLFLEKPLDLNGKYLLYIKRGEDGNTLLNRCGFELKPYTAFMIDVTNCPYDSLEILNVSVENDTNIHLDWTLNPAFFPAGADKLFNRWAIYRYLNGTVNNIFTIDDMNTRHFEDTAGIGEWELDHDIYTYEVRIDMNGSVNVHKSNFVSSLLLSDTLSNDSTKLQLSWNNFGIAWSSPFYQISIGTADTINGAVNFDWQPFDVRDSAYFSNTYTLPPKDSLSTHWYAAKVDAIDSLDPSNNFVAQSNWIYFGTELADIIPPVPDTLLGTAYIPNVITPNGDGQNDRFYLTVKDLLGKEPSGGQAYRLHDKIELSVYNRYGVRVFEDLDFASKNNANDGWDGTNMNNGQKLADGVYFYVIHLSDTETAQQENIQGSLTLFSNGSN